MGTTQQKDFMLEVARGNISGYSQVNKFGANSSITDAATGDVWDGGGAYPFPASADITHLRQATDQAAMQGEDVEIQGLDTNWDLVVQTVTLDGSDTTTPVALGTALRRVFRMKVIADVVTDEDIELRNVGGGTDYAIIQAGNNQTLMAIYTVPAGKTAYMVQYYADGVESTGKEPKSIDFNLWVRDNENSYEFQLKHSRATSKGETTIQQSFTPYMKITEKSDIKMDASPSGEDGSVHAGFDLILIDD